MKKSDHLRINFRKNARDCLTLTPKFYPGAQELRDQFTSTFHHPFEAKSARFCWDYWSVPNQYRLLRTPAEAFFTKKLFRSFLEYLLAWGRENLGCQMISKPWLSAYTDGCFQKLHSDVPHGPYSFVYSLTPWQVRRFNGGETLIAQPKLLRYFLEWNSDQSHEEKDFFRKVSPHFNQLTVFDPRYPHGVERVEGVEDLNAARLVIHGWFTEPRPMVEGSLTPLLAEKTLDQIAHFLLGEFSTLPYSGLFSVRFEIGSAGKIEEARILASHLLDSRGEVIAKKRISDLMKAISAFTFAKRTGRSRVTLPLMIGINPH